MNILRALLLLLLAASGPARAAEEMLKFYGYAYDLASGAYVYTEVHHQRVVDGRWAGGTIDYFTPAAERFGHKDLDFGQDRFVPLFRLEFPAQGYLEGITGARDALAMERRMGAGRPVQKAVLEREDPVCADSGFHAYLRAQFERLLAGETLDFHLAVAGSLDQFRFRAHRIEDTLFEGAPAVRIKVEPGSMLRFMVDPLQLTYRAEGRKLLEYRGITNVHDPRTGKAYRTRIAYYSQPPADAPRLPPLD